MSDQNQDLADGSAVVATAPASGAPKAKDLHNSGYNFWKTYDDTEDLEDLQKAIQATERAVTLSETPFDRAESLYNLAIQFRTRYMRTKVAADLEKASSACEEGMKHLPVDHSKRASWLGLLGDLFEKKHAISANMADLDQAVELSRHAVDSTAEGHPDRGHALAYLGVSLWARFVVSNQAQDRVEAMRVTRQSLEILGPDSPIRDQSLFNLAIQTMDTGSEGRSAADLDEAIKLGQEAITIRRRSTIGRSLQLRDLSGMLMVRYEATQQKIDLDCALSLTRESFELVPRNHPDKSRTLKSLLRIFQTHCSKTDDADEIAHSVQFIQEITALVLQNQPYLLLVVANVTDWLMDRYQKFKSNLDLEEAIRVSRKALESLSPEHPDRALQLHRLLKGLNARYEKAKSSDDLDKLIELNLELVPHLEEDEEHKRKHIGDLCRYFNDRYWPLRNQSDLREAIRYGREAFSNASLKNGSEELAMNAFIQSLQLMHWMTGDKEYVEESIRATEGVVAVASQNSSLTDPYEAMTNLSIIKAEKYHRTGAVGDFEDYSRFCRDLFYQGAQDHPLRYRALLSYGDSLYCRYRRVGALEDLEEAISIWRKARNIAPENSQSRFAILFELQNALKDRYGRKRELPDLDEAIELAREAHALGFIDQRQKVTITQSLSGQLEARYHVNGSLKDLQESMQLLRGALNWPHLDDIEKARLWHSLGCRLHMNYNLTRDIGELNETIALGRKSLKILPMDDPWRAEILDRLGSRYREKSYVTKSPRDLASACECWLGALHFENTPNADRIGSGEKAIKLASVTGNWKIAYSASRVALDLIPGLIAQSLRSSDKQYQLRRVAGIGSLAAGAAIRAGQPATVALELLEKGRGVLAASVEEIRADVQDLRHSHPELAEKLSSLGRELDNLPKAEDDLKGILSKQPGASADKRFDTSKEFELILNQIREQKGFEDFLQSPTADDMCLAATSGPIVVINVTDYECDAVLVDQHYIRFLPLPLLKMEDIELRIGKQCLGSLEVLCWLWRVIAKPVLDALGFDSARDEGQLRRIWWIPTGPLTLFPIHAAGDYLSEGLIHGDSVLDRVVSSYSSSIGAIIRARRRPVKTPTKQALLVAMGQTPGATPLPLVEKEISLLKDVCTAIGLDSVQPDGRTAADIMKLLLNSSVFHFAGHGHTNTTDPSMSHLLVGENGVKERITVGDLMNMNLRESAPFLAYLSACGTGRVVDERSYDESIHLVGAFQLAGFRHVIGTLWEVRDEVCVDMARLVYQGIGSDGLERDESICIALHKASMKLRRQWLESRALVRDGNVMRTSKPGVGAKRGEPIISQDEMNIALGNCVIEDVDRSSRDIISSDEEEEGSIEPPWVPFVHFGV
jgi:hypothetical protein